MPKVAPSEAENSERRKMKHTRKLLTWILAVALIVLTCSLVACVEKPKTQELTELTLPTLAPDEMAVIVKNGEKDYTNVVVTLGINGVQAKTAEDVLAYLAKEKILQIDWTDSQYGKMLNSIGNCKPNASKNEYVSVFTSVSADKGVWAGVKTYTVSSVEIAMAAVGVSSMTVEPGAVIYFEVDSY